MAESHCSKLVIDWSLLSSRPETFRPGLAMMDWLIFSHCCWPTFSHLSPVCLFFDSSGLFQNCSFGGFKVISLDFEVISFYYWLKKSTNHGGQTKHKVYWQTEQSKERIWQFLAGSFHSIEGYWMTQLDYLRLVLKHLVVSLKISSKLQGV